MKDIPCINPICTHMFPGQEVARANVLKCPRCGQEIQLRAAPKAPPTAALAAPVKKAPPAGPPPRPVSPGPAKSPPLKPASPLAAPPARPIPVARPAPLARPAPQQEIQLPPPPAPAPARAEPAFMESLEDLDGVSSGPPSAIRRRPSSGWSFVTLFGVGFIVLGMVLITVLVLRKFRGEEERKSLYDGPTRVTVYSIFNFEKKKEPAFNLVLPSDRQWAQSDDFKTKLNLQAEWHDQETGTWLVVGATDFGLQRPRDAEMIRIGMEQLYSIFDESLEMEQLPKPSKLAGKAAQKLQFKGRDGAVIRWGELHLLSHHGIGLWVYAIGPELEKCQEVLQWLEERNLGLAFDSNMRKGWSEQPPPTETFVSISGAVKLTTPERLYEKFDAPKEMGIDVPADLYLLGRYRKEKDNRKNAHVQVFQLEAQKSLDDAMKKAKEHVLALASAGGGTGYSLTVSPDAESDMGELGKSMDLGSRRGRLGDFCMLLDGKRERYYTIAVVNESDRLFVIVCDVVWDNRQIWHQDFEDMLHTLKLRE